MMKELRYQNRRISRLVRNVSPLKQTSNQIINNLLDGSRFVQTIGNPSQHITFEVACTREQTENINAIQASGGVFTLFDEGKEYTGFIAEPVDWRRQIFRKEPGASVFVGAARLNIL